MARPQLSIGIIFKNEIRCLERCLKSFQALREAVPCEIVMADTGSTDGSYEIAAKYADILFNFPWVNDFAAARNAVMDRCSGKWFLTVDADEWLDEDISELVSFLRSNRKRDEKIGTVIIRNYLTDRLSAGEQSDFVAIRLIRMSSGMRYKGIIHEKLPVSLSVDPAIRFTHTILQHDGYIGLNSERGRAKRERNLALLEIELEKNPDDAQRLLQYIESSRMEPDYMERVRRGVEAVAARKPGWRTSGPPIMRHAVFAAYDRKLPEAEEWADTAAEWFPNSFFVNIDIAYYIAILYWNKQDFEKCRQWGGKYCQAIADFKAGRGDMNELASSSLLVASPKYERSALMLYAKSLYRTGNPENADTILLQVDLSSMDSHQIRSHIRNLIELHAEAVLLALYERFSSPEYPEAQAKQHIDIFLQTAAATFAETYQKKEEAQEGFTCHAYTLFAALADRNEIGTAAVIMQTGNIAELEQLLREVEDWDYLPVAALEHVLEKGVQFPPSGKLLSLEAMDKLAGRLGKNAALAAELTLQAADRISAMDLPGLLWARGVAIVAVQACDWKDAEHGMRLCRAFARIVGAFVTRYYTEEALCGDNFRMLPGMYRSAWYCQEAFKALDGGDCGMYIKLLREGLLAYPGTKKMASFLLDSTPEVQELLAPPPEVQALADQVRAVLARYAPDDPAVVALKQSEAYQKVAHLLEDSQT